MSTEITDGNDQAVLDNDKIITFPNGIPGIDGHTRFRLLHDNDNESDERIVYCLQSEHDPEVQLPVAKPYSLQVNYQITLDDDESELLHLDGPEDVVLLILLYRTPIDATEIKSTEEGGINANLLGPLVINAKTRIGLQKVLNSYSGSVNIQA